MQGPKNEGIRVTDWLMSKEDDLGEYSLDNGTLASGNNLVTGSVLGAVSATIAASPAVKSGGNTGNGTLASVTPWPPARNGIYTVRITATAANAGAFEVKDPGGKVIGTGTVGVAFSTGGLTFTVADGSTDFAVGDGFDITVTGAVVKFTQFDPTANDGSQYPAGVLLNSVDATSADKPCVVVVREALVVPDFFTWKTGVTNAQKAAAVATLKSNFIVPRASV